MARANAEPEVAAPEEGEIFEPETLESEMENQPTSPNEEENFFGEWSTSTAQKKGLKVLLYGASGSGKTRMAATFPKPLFLDLESGLRSTLALGPVLRFPADPKEEIQSLEDVKRFYSLAKGAKPGKFETIVIDSLNELQLLLMKNILRRFDATRHYEDQPTMADYGKLARDFQSIIRLFLKLPYHVVFTAVETPREFPEQQVGPQFIGKKTGPEVQRMVEMIGYCHVVSDSNGSPVHQVSFQQSALYVAKDRMGISRSVIPNDYNELVRASTR